MNHRIDRRLDRLIEFDSKSRAHDYDEVRTARPPIYRVWTCGLVLDQGSEGACVGASWTHELAAEPTAIKGLTMAWAREQIYWAAQKIDQWPGGAYPGASPRMEGTSVLAGARILKQRGFLERYRWCFHLDDLVDALAYHGPCVLGIEWRSGMYRTAGDLLRVTGDVVGGHAIMAAGVDPEHERVLLHNSWGRGWGQDGRAWISYADLAQLLAANGEACVPLVRRDPAVQPVIRPWFDQWRDWFRRRWPF